MRQMTVMEYKELLDSGADHVLLDVREPDELAIAAIHPCLEVPMRTIPQRMEELPKDKPIVVVCHTGTRSMQVCQFLDQSGYDNVVNLMGGINAWSRQIDPSVPLY